MDKTYAITLTLGNNNKPNSILNQTEKNNINSISSFLLLQETWLYDQEFVNKFKGDF